MGLLGILGLLMLVVLFALLFNEVENYTGFVIGVFLCIGLIVYDKTSPVETTKSFIVTNDFEKYNINVVSDEPMRIKVVEEEATRFGAVFGDSTEYFLLTDD